MAVSERDVTAKARESVPAQTMFAFLTNFEFTILWLPLALGTAIAYLRYRWRRRGSGEAMGGCLSVAIKVTICLAVLIALSTFSTWKRTRPEKMLARFLKVEDGSQFDDLRGHYTKFGFEYTAWLYFRTTPARLGQLVDDLEFRRLPDGKPNQGLDFAPFPGAPTPPAPDQAVVYTRQSPENYDIQYIVTNRAHDRAWFVSLDF